ncbi:MAG TPA: NeuD/PglB/VioB family sugar acetyltransferase [Anaerolineaceae bacterium]
METAPVEIPEIKNEPAYWLSGLLAHEGQAVKKGDLLARLEGQEIRELCCEITSPRNGFVVGLHASPGQLVRPGEILCYICSRPSIPATRPGLGSAAAGPASFDPTAIIVFGGGGHGKTIIDLLRAMGTYRVVGVFDDTLPQGTDVLGVPVLGGSQDLEEWHDRGIHLAVNAVGGIGNVTVRLKIFDLLARAGFTCPAVVHPSAVIERSAVLEAGVQVCAQAYVGSAARVGFGTLVNTGVIIHHDCVIGQVVNLSPGATLAGNVRVENHAQIGMLATVNLKITVGEGAMLGNGCTVKADVPAGTRVWAGAIWPEPKKNISK